MNTKHSLLIANLVLTLVLEVLGLVAGTSGLAVDLHLLHLES